MYTFNFKCPHLLLSVNFIYVFHVLVLHKFSCSHIPYLVVSPRTMLREPVGYCHGETEQTQTDTVHLWSDGNVSKECTIPAHGSAAAFKVFDNVEDLLALCLSHHPPNIQQSGNMLFPVERRMEAGRQEYDSALTINWWSSDSFLIDNNEGYKEQNDFDRSGLEKLILITYQSSNCQVLMPILHSQRLLIQMCRYILHSKMYYKLSASINKWKLQFFKCLGALIYWYIVKQSFHYWRL